MKLTFLHSTFAILISSFPGFAWALDPHVEAVIRTVEAAKDKVERRRTARA